MEGIGILVLKITRYVLSEEKREPFSEGHEEMELSVCCNSLCALWGLAEQREMLKSSAKSLCERGKLTHLVISLIAIRKSKTLETSSWGLHFVLGLGRTLCFVYELIVFCLWGSSEAYMVDCHGDQNREVYEQCSISKLLGRLPEGRKTLSRERILELQLH